MSQKSTRTARILVYARYLLPPVSALVLIVSGFLNIVYGVLKGEIYTPALWTLYKNVFVEGHQYFGAQGSQRGNQLFTTWIIGSVVGLLLLLVALALIILATVTALRAFRKGRESAESNRMKVIFQVVFPNRFCLFLPHLLLILPTLYANFFSEVSAYFSLVGVIDVFYITVNYPLIIQLVLAAVTLVLAFLSPRYERQLGMDMYEIWYPEQPEEEPQGEEENDTEE